MGTGCTGLDALRAELPFHALMDCVQIGLRLVQIEAVGKIAAARRCSRRARMRACTLNWPEV